MEPILNWYEEINQLHYVISVFLQRHQCRVEILLLDHNIICVVGRYRKYTYLVFGQNG